MNRRVALLAALLGLALAAAVPAPAAPQPPPTADELTKSPYRLPGGTQDNLVRAERHEHLAGVALAAHDPARAARHDAVACYVRSEMVLDVALRAPACGRARALAREHHLADVEASLLTTEGNLRAWSLDVAGAVARLQEALVVGQAVDPDGPAGAPVTSAHFALGAILIEGGQFDLAQRELSFARDHCGVAGDPVCVAFADIWRCRLHTQLGELEAARAACDAAQAGAGLDVFVAMNLGWIQADLESSLGRHDAALAALQQAWQAAQRRGGELLQPTLMNSIANTLVILGRLDEADAWQHQLERLAAEGVLPAGYAPQTAMRRGQIALARGRLDEAIAAFTIASGSPMYEMAIGGDYALAKARHARNDLAGARTALERAIARIEAGRTTLEGTAHRASYMTMHARTYGELIGVLWDEQGGAAAARALELAEKSRARALLDALASAQVAGAAAPTLDAAGVQSRLGADDVLVEYVSSADRLFAITVTRDHIGFVPLPGAGSAEQLAQRVGFFAALVQEGGEADLGPAGQRLYDDLLAPALAGTGPAARTLIVAADGPLPRLPFDTLGGSTRVIDRWDVVTLPSASALAHRPARAPRSATALVVAAPAGTNGFAPLPAAPAEAAALRRRLAGEIADLSGASATRERLQAADPGRFTVLHFASHALVDEADPMRSALVLAPRAPGGDGHWRAEDIYRTRLGADLVVLSACGTAAGSETRGEGVMSLSRAFLYAGAGATIATLWDVPDAPGPVFADVLYRELGAGRPLGAAVAEARRELRRRGAPPRAWAAYTLTGNPGAQVGVTARSSQGAAAGRFAAMLAAVLLITAAALGLKRVARPVAWPAPALAGAGLAVIAVVLLPWPVRYPDLSRGTASDRGVQRETLVPTLEGGRLSWPAIAGADESLLETYDNAGLPIGAPRQAASPFAVPVTAAGGWIRVQARQHGRVLAQSAWLPLPGTARSPETAR